MSVNDREEEMYSINEYESPWARVIRKSKEEPLVSLGCVATVGALISATVNLRRGNRAMGQRMLRYRVIFQAFTLVAAAGGSIYLSQKEKAKKLQAEVAAQSSSS